MAENKKIIPKLKKQLQWFLSDESGKITKEDVLKIALWAMMVWSMVGDVSAGHTNNSTCTVIPSTSSFLNWWNTSGTATHINSTANVVRWCTTVTDTMIGTVYVNASIAPYSVTVNGHANGNATINGWGFNWLNANISQWQSHGNHSNHGSHGSHGQW